MIKPDVSITPPTTSVTDLVVKAKLAAVMVNSVASWTCCAVKLRVASVSSSVCCGEKVMSFALKLRDADVSAEPMASCTDLADQGNEAVVSTKVAAFCIALAVVLRVAAARS